MLHVGGDDLTGALQVS